MWRAFSMNNRNWKSGVYRRPAKQSPFEKHKWVMIKRFILDRDSQVCLRCDRYFRSQKDLGVHHLIPRDEGGSDAIENLVTLCHHCHDYVEINGLKTRADIMGSIDLDVLIIEYSEDGIENFERPEWHAVVYGGMRKCPQKGRGSI
jgi:hypothetical protein